MKPFSGAENDALGLYLAPASDLDEIYTADYELSIVSRGGHVLSLALHDGCAHRAE